MFGNSERDRHIDEKLREATPDQPTPSEAVHVTADYGQKVGTEGSTSKIVYWLLGGLMAANVSISVAFFAWTATSIVELQRDIAVIKCQLSPDCLKVLTNGK